VSIFIFMSRNFQKHISYMHTISLIIVFLVSLTSSYTQDKPPYSEATTSHDPAIILCPIAFSQDQFNTELDKIICAAPDDFYSVQGHLDKELNGFESWKTQNVALDGVRKMYIASGGPLQDFRQGKDFIITFICKDSTNLEINQAYFMELQKIVADLKPSCCTLDQGAVKEYLTDKLFASVISRGKIKHPTLGNVPVEVELDLVHVASYYSILLHVSVPKKK